MQTYNPRTHPKAQNTYKDQKPKTSAWSKIKYVALGCLIGGYIAGNTVESQRLSKELQPLREEFTNIIKESGLDYSFDYGGRLEELVIKKNQFAKDNGAIPRPWKSVIIPGAETNLAETPRPRVYNVFRWGQDINTEALGKYQR